MADPSKTIHKLTAENAALKKRIEELKAADTEIKLRAQYDSMLESERSLRESEGKYRRLTETAHDLIVSVDLNWKITYVNPSTLNIAGGMNPVGMRLLDFTPSHLHELQEALMQKRREGFSDVLAFEWEIPLPTGKDAIFEIRSSLITENEKPSGVLFVARDITDRKRAEEALRKSEEKHRRLFETMEQGVIYQAADGVIVSANPTAQRILGLTFEQMQGKTSMDPRWQMIAEDGTPVAGEDHPAMIALRTGQIVGPVIRGVFHPDKNSHIWLSITAIPLFQPGQKEPFQAYATFSDITERKQAEEALRLSEERFRTLFQYAPVLIDGFDGAGRCVLWNEKCREVFGWTMDEINQHEDPLSLFYPDPAARDVVKKSVTSEPDGRFSEFHPVTRDGRELVAMWANFAIADGTIINVGYDLTEHRLTEEALQKSEEKYRSLFNQSMEGIYLHDLEGRILDVNEMACAQSGYSREEWLGLTIFDGHPIESTMNLPKAKMLQAWSLWEPGQRFTVEAEHKRKDGTVYPVEISTGMVCYENLNVMMAIVKDITERKAVERKLRAAEETYRNIFLNAQIGMFRTDIKTGLVLDANNALARFAGYRDRKEMLAEPFNIAERYVDPGDREKMISLLMADGEFTDFEAPFRHNDGTTILMRYSARLIPERGWIEGVSVDITRERQAEDRLRLLAQAVEQSPATVVETDLEGRIVYANPKFEETTGYSIAEVIGQNPRILKSGETPPEEYAKLWATIASGREWRGEFHNKRKDGSMYWESASISPIFDAAGKITNFLAVKEDITLRKQAEDELRETSERLRLANKATNDVIWDWDVIQDTQRWNEAGTAVFGWTEIVERPVSAHWWVERVHPDDRERVHDSFFAAVNNPEIDVWHAEYRFTKADGTDADVLDRGYVLRDDQGKAIRMIGAMQDITERKQAEEKLRKSEERHRTILNTAMDGFFVTDSAGRFVEINATYCRMSGYSEQELLRLSVNSVEDVETAADTAAHLQKVMAEGQDRFESRHHRKDGSVFDVEVSVKLQPADKSQFVVFVRDITERRRAENALLESEERFRAANNASLDCLLLLHSDRDEAGQIKDFIFFDLNRRAEEMLHMDRDHLIGRRLCEELPINREAGFFEKYKHVVDTGLPLEEEFFLPETHVPAAWYYHQVVKVHDGIFICHRDITGRKQAEAEREKLRTQLTQAQKMESVGRLAGGVAHDFNNMLGVILGHTEMAMDEMDPSQPLYNDMQQIRKAAERSADLTRQLLAFARKQTIDPRVLDLNDTVEGMLKMLRRLIGEDIDLAWMPGKNLGPVKMDPSQIDQILANLCVNARDAIEGVGKITIETHDITFDEAYCAAHTGFIPGEYVLLAVSDDGRGMDKETQSHLFEPFFTTKGVGEGTGLGLATVYGIVKQNNGFINVYSEPGQGTRFTIYLPRHAGTAGLNQTTDSAKPAKRGHETILLVEDEPAILQMTALLLERLGYKVLSTDEPGKAIRLAEEHPGRIDLLMTDVVMPEMNGRDLAGKILTFSPNLRCLFMSGYTADVIARHGVLDEGVQFIQKPFSRKDLAAKVRETLDGE